MEIAARLMRFVWMKLQSLTRLNEFDLGKRLHENIGVIGVRLDGKLYKTLDLGYWLAHVESRLAAVEGWDQSTSPRTSRDKLRASFRLWKLEVEARRRELGMSVDE